MSLGDGRTPTPLIRGYETYPGATEHQGLNNVQYTFYNMLLVAPITVYLPIASTGPLRVGGPLGAILHGKIYAVGVLSIL